MNTNSIYTLTVIKGQDGLQAHSLLAKPGSNKAYRQACRKVFPDSSDPTQEILNYEFKFWEFTPDRGTILHLNYKPQ